VAVLGLLALFTHIHLFWIAALLLAMIDLPDFGTPLRSIAESAERIADAADPGGNPGDATREIMTADGLEPVGSKEVAKELIAPKKEVHGHA